jgi:hypothetical protein
MRRNSLWGCSPGYTLREMLLVLVIVGLFTAAVVPFLAGDKPTEAAPPEKTVGQLYQDTLRTVLTRLVGVQRNYLRNKKTYLDDLTKPPGYTPRKPASVEVFVTAASATGWRALATHPFFDITCGVSHGTGVRPGEIEDAPTCGAIQEPALVTPISASDSAIQRLPWASVGLIAPRRMSLEQPSTVTLVLDPRRPPPEPKIFRELPRAAVDSFVAGVVTVSPSGDSSSRVDPYAVRVTPYMEAELRVPGARVVPSTDAPVAIAGDSVAWRWTVIPMTEDTLRLTLRVRALPDSSLAAIPPRPREVASISRTALVDVSWPDRVARVWTQDRAALIVIASGLAAVAAAAVYAGRRRPPRAVPKR